MNGSRKWPSRETPSRMARRSSSSLHAPTPVSTSGVMFGIQTPSDMPRATKMLPPPRKPSVRSGSLAMLPFSRVVWHAPQAHTWLTRYPPRMSRSGVASTFSGPTARTYLPPQPAAARAPSARMRRQRPTSLFMRRRVGAFAGVRQTGAALRADLDELDVEHDRSQRGTEGQHFLAGPELAEGEVAGQPQPPLVSLDHVQHRLAPAGGQAPQRHGHDIRRRE